MTKTGRAAVVRAFKEPLVIQEVPVLAPDAGQILIRIAASGVCRTDLDAPAGDWPVKPKPPFISGHEGVGHVAAVDVGIADGRHRRSLRVLRRDPGCRDALPKRRSTMKLHLCALLAGLALLAGCATGPKPADDKPSGQEQRLTEKRAVVAGVDQQRRLLALATDGGGTAVLPVAEEFRDFEKLRVGDAVVVSLTEAVAWQVKPSDKGAPGVSKRETLSNPRPGEAPGGAIEHAITVTATITAFDLARGTVTLAGPEGRSQTVKVHRPADLEHIRVGDLVDITYSEVRALAVRPAVKP